MWGGKVLSESSLTCLGKLSVYLTPNATEIKRCRGRINRCFCWFIEFELKSLSVVFQEVGAGDFVRSVQSGPAPTRTSRHRLSSSGFRGQQQRRRLLLKHCFHHHRHLTLKYWLMLSTNRRGQKKHPEAASRGRVLDVDVRRCIVTSALIIFPGWQTVNNSSPIQTFGVHVWVYVDTTGTCGKANTTCFTVTKPKSGFLFFL